MRLAREEQMRRVSAAERWYGHWTRTHKLPILTAAPVAIAKIAEESYLAVKRSRCSDQR